jgi:cytochrome c-type biogenesis protein CcmH
MMTWIAIGTLAFGAFVIAAFVLRLPQEGWGLFGAALVFGLTGYVWQGSPEQPSSPKPEQKREQESGEVMIGARETLFPQTVQKPSYLITADGFARRGQFADAAGFLRQGLRDNPKHAEGWLALGMALVEHADGNVTPAALDAYQRASAINPDNPAPEFFLGAAYLRGQQFREARAVWAALLKRTPENAPWRTDLEQRVAALDEMIASAPFAQGGRPAE